MFAKALREGLGRLVVFIDIITRPKPMVRSPAEQRTAEDAAKSMALYQFHACPFCIRTRRTIHRLGVPIELRDAQNDPLHRESLRAGGGKIMVPCLHIEEDGQDTWMYESADIIAYLNIRFGAHQDVGDQPLKPAA